MDKLVYNHVLSMFDFPNQNAFLESIINYKKLFSTCEEWIQDNMELKPTPNRSDWPYGIPR